MPSTEELRQQQLQQQINQDHAIQNELLAQDRARQAVAGKIPKTTEISGIEFALIGFVAAIKDSVDIIGDIAIIGPIINILTNIFCLSILWLWCIFKLGKLPLKRFLGAGLGEFIPYLDALPFWTSFVISVYLEQRGYIPKFIKKIANPIPGQK